MAQLNQKRQRSLFIPPPYNKYTPIIGQLHSLWLNGKRVVQALLGTAFAINPKIIITCAHNVYSIRQREQANHILFYPTPTPRKQLVHPLKFYRARVKGYNNIKTVDFTLEPLLEQLVILVIEQQLPQIPQLVFPVLGNLYLPKQNNAKYQIVTIGYPSENRRSQKLKRGDKFNLWFTSGTIHSLKDEYKLNYTMQTRCGLDGSPLFVKKQNGEVILVGVHTHNQAVRQMYINQLRNYDSGLHFSLDILDAIKNFFQDFYQNQVKKQKFLYRQAKKPQFYEQAKKKQKVIVSQKQQIKNDQQISWRLKQQQQWKQETTKINDRIQSSYHKFQMQNSSQILTQAKDQIVNWPVINKKMIEKNFPYLTIRPEPSFNPKQNSQVYGQNHKENQNESSSIQSSIGLKNNQESIESIFQE